jgi:putative nucleotidyltransferase with HDIG domain
LKSHGIPAVFLNTGDELGKGHNKSGRVFEQVIQAISSIVAVKDPYTSFHQLRVSFLCAEIAREMNLSEVQIQGIRMAAMVHDVGKIIVPSEILSKPGKLNEIECKLVRSHCAVGYEIVKGIEFPWPVAQIVLQHHERLNGTGYPSGLKQQDIILGARILGVADVIEAMASYRPYRPALGLTQALNELNLNKFVLYDYQVVEASEAVIQKPGFDVIFSDFVA